MIKLPNDSGVRMANETTGTGVTGSEKSVRYILIKAAIKYITYIGIGIHRYTIHQRFRKVQTI
jgi:hypothetical protein